MNSFRYYLLSFLILFFTVFVLQSCFESTGPSENKERFSHGDQPGSSANHFLADSNYTDLVIEVDYMPEYKPNEQALDSLKAFLYQHLNKSSITIKSPTEIPTPGQSRYSGEDVRNLEKNYRSTFTRGDTLAAYMLIVDGKYTQENVLGIAYYNTSNAFFGASYDEAASGVGSPSRYRIETTSFSHEFGHLFGLVANPYSGTEMQNEHQDSENGYHCDNENCLMYYAIESTDLIGNTIGDEGVPSLDANCRADLEANGGK